MAQIGFFEMIPTTTGCQAYQDNFKYALMRNEWPVVLGQSIFNLDRSIKILSLVHKITVKYMLNRIHLRK